MLRGFVGTILAQSSFRSGKVIIFGERMASIVALSSPLQSPTSSTSLVSLQPITSSTSLTSLVQEADRLHEVAAALNAEGRHAEATAGYVKFQEALSAADALAALETDATALKRLKEAANTASVAQPGPFPTTSTRDIARSRIVGCIVGAACGDAAAMALHWVYDMDKLAALLSGGQEATFFEPPQSAFYNYPQGESSPYGQQARALLRSIVELQGFSAHGYAAENFATFAQNDLTFKLYLDASTKGNIRSTFRAR